MNGIPAPPDAVRTRWPIAVVVVVALVMHGWLATLPVNELISRGLLNDDAFYAFTIARNIAQGYGSTFDRVTLTNGYQPLYVWLLVPIFRLWDDLESPVRVAFGVLALVNVLSGLLLYRLIIRLTNDAGAAAVGTAYWVVNPLFVKRTLNGLETPLAVAMLLLVLLYWTTWLAGGAAQRNGRWLGFGLLLGTALLTRMDLVFAAAALCAAGALIHRAERPRYVVRWLLAAMGIAVALSPWMWFGLSRVGSALPMSAESVRHWIVYRTGGTPNLLQRLDWASRSVISITMATSAWSLLRAKWPVAPLWMAGVLVGTMVAAAALLILPGMRARGRRVWLAHREVHLACGLYVGCMFVFYSFYMPAIWYFDRYYAPVYAVYALYAGLLTHHLWTGGRGETRRSAGRGLRRIAPAVAAIPLLLFFGSYFGPGSRNGFYEAALWMRQNLPADARVGSYLAGYLGYFSDRQVINLDGKVNREAMLALQAGRMREYLRGAGVSFVADWPSYLRALEARGGPVVGRDLVRRIYVDRSFFDYSIFVFDPQR